MRFVADLHIHSHFSISTSPQLSPEYLDLWAAIKGIAVVGTGDFTHPGWLAELEEKLEPAGEGLYRLRPDLRRAARRRAETEGLPVPEGEARFLLSAEISNIYRRGGRTRKVHNLILATDFAAARRLQRRLERHGNISSDGRPILGMDSRDLLEITLEACPGAVFIPAHIWTPWFSALGEKSGFDRIAECYADLAGHVRAVETGLSSDPPMNWLCSFLDRYTLISNSDAHSPEKLGREANLFDTELSYPAIAEALEGVRGGFAGTVELFPQEGKYHFDGHRKCRVSASPLESLRYGGTCPACGKPFTAGVLSRVAGLADRDALPDPSLRRPFYSLIPLKEILAEIHEVGAGSRRVARHYGELIGRAGPELDLLMHRPITDVEKLGGELLGEAIRRMRAGAVQVRPGFDGEYGTVHLFAPGETRSLGLPELALQGSGAGPESRPAAHAAAPAQRPLLSFDVGAFRRLRRQLDAAAAEANATAGALAAGGLAAGGAGARAGGDPGPEEPGARPFEPDLLGQGVLFPGAMMIRGERGQPGGGEPGRPPSKGRVFSHGLTEAQEAAAAHLAGAALVLAGPGAGKTRTLAARIDRLVNQRGVDPERILAVTFTNRAAGEMRDRLGGLRGRELPVTVCTFHALGRSLLSEFLAETGRDGEFPLLDQEDRARILSRLPGCTGRQAAEGSAAIGTAKQQLQPPEAVGEPGLQELYALYQERLAALGAFDLDDLLFEPVRRLSADTALAARLRDRFRWLLVDEYQDINEAEYRLVRLLAPDTSAGLWAVGDPNQAIYSFRGADVRFIRRFLEDYPGAAVYRLSESFRCSGTILRASAQVLGMAGPALPDGRGTTNRPETASVGPAPALFPPGDVRIRISEHPSEAGEAEAVARAIEAMMGGLRFFSMDSRISEGEAAEGIQGLADFAVLCRIGRQMGAIERAFRDHAIPYQKAEADPYWKLEPARLLLDLARAVRLARRGGEARELIPELSPAEHGRLAEVAEGPGGPVRGLLSRLVELCPPEMLAGAEAQETLERLLEHSTRFGDDLHGFLTYTALGSGPDGLVGSRRPAPEGVREEPAVPTSPRRSEGRGELVSLLTLHAAKGLEFTCVFIVGCEEGLLPYSLHSGSGCDPEEERRLCYVGMTRARRYLFLSHARRRRLFGRDLALKRSPFVTAIQRELTELVEPPQPRRKETGGQLELF